MTWVSEARAALEAGRETRVRPVGGSMRGRIESGQLVTIVPATAADITVDDVVFIKWKGNYLLHLVKEIDGDRILIGNALGKVNGWVDAGAILGKVTEVRD
ncbi:MAG: hypothetical protein JW751_19030 [Polyangiaceae bacterium]|nr:hypothetical protein [Polyangiaceae bacterium]